MSRAAYSTIELIVVLVLLAILLAIAVPHASGWRDRFAVRAARDELVAALAWTRVAAAGGGGATLVVQADSGRFHTSSSGGRLGPAADLLARYGVRLEGARGTIEIRYDGLGIGRLANRTIRLRRGSATGGVVVSAYGRVRSW